MLMKCCAFRKYIMTESTHPRIKKTPFGTLRRIVARSASVFMGITAAIFTASFAGASSAVPPRPDGLLSRAIAAQQDGQWVAALADVQKAIHAGNTQPAAINLLIATARQQHHIGAAYLLVADLAAQHRITVSQSRNIIEALIRHGPVQTLPEELVHARNNSGYGTQDQWAWRDYLLGVAAAESGQYQQAIDWLQASRLASPKFWPATELLADQLATDYQFATAQQVLQSAIKARWHPRQAYHDLIGIYCAQDRLRKALILAQDAAGKYKTSAEFQVLVARVYGLRQQQNIEQIVLARVVRKFPHFKPAYLDLLELAQNNGDGGLIENISHRYIRHFPHDVFSTVLQSRLAAQQGNAVLSGRILARAMKKKPANVQLWLARIELALALKQNKAATLLVRHALVLNPDSLLLNQTLCGLLASKPQDAIAAAQAFANRHLQSPSAQQAYVQTLLQYKHFAPCRAFLHPLIKRYPAGRWIQQSWANYLDATHAYQAERKFLIKLTSGSAPRISDLLLLATLDYQLHDLSGEEMAYKAVLQIEPANSMAANDLGYTLTVENKELPYAQKIIEIAVKNHPGDAASRDSLGWVFYKQGHYQRALKQLKQAVELPGGQSPEGLEHLGAVIDKLGHSARAIGIWKLALKQLDDSPKLSPHQHKVKRRIEDRIKKAKLFRDMQNAGGKMM